MVVGSEEQLERVFDCIPIRSASKNSNKHCKALLVMSNDEKKKPYSTEALLTAVAIAAAVEDKHGNRQDEANSQRGGATPAVSDAETASNIESDEDHSSTSSFPTHPKRQHYEKHQLERQQKEEEEKEGLLEVTTGVIIDQSNSSKALQNIPQAGRENKARKSGGAARSRAVDHQAPADAGSSTKANGGSSHPKRIARPFNSFILYRMDKQAEIISQKPGLNHKIVSCFVAEAWRKEPESVKQVYRAKAEQYKAQHRRLYPEWKLVRRAKRRKEDAVESNESLSDQSQEKGKGLDRTGVQKVAHSSKAAALVVNGSPKNVPELPTSGPVVTTLPMVNQQQLFRYHTTSSAPIQAHPTQYPSSSHIFPLAPAGSGLVTSNGPINSATSGQNQQTIYFYTPAVIPAQYASNQNGSHVPVYAAAVYGPLPPIAKVSTPAPGLVPVCKTTTPKAEPPTNC